MFPRIREIRDGAGTCLRISVESQPAGALILLERRDQHGRPHATLDAYGVDILAGYIISARLAVSGDLPVETVRGQFPSRFQLLRRPDVAIAMTQADAPPQMLIPASIWDRLFAELSLVTAHARELGRRSAPTLQ